MTVSNRGSRNSILPVGNDSLDNNEYTPYNEPNFETEYATYQNHDYAEYQLPRYIRKSRFTLVW